jgi:hypothetical protein
MPLQTTSSSLPPGAAGGTLCVFQPPGFLAGRGHAPERTAVPHRAASAHRIARVRGNWDGTNGRPDRPTVAKPSARLMALSVIGGGGTRSGRTRCVVGSSGRPLPCRPAGLRAERVFLSALARSGTRPVMVTTPSLTNLRAGGHAVDGRREGLLALSRPRARRLHRCAQRETAGAIDVKRCVLRGRTADRQCAFANSRIGLTGTPKSS